MYLALVLYRHNMYPAKNLLSSYCLFYTGRRSFFFDFFFSSRRRHTRLTCDWSSDVCSSDLVSQAVNVAVRNLDKLTVAAINGFAIQTGFSFALACDFRIAARSARLGSATLRFALLQIGRASCRERGEISGGAGSLKRKKGDG